MQTVYRINTISGFKPWRSAGPYYVTDKEVFDMVVKAAADGGEFDSIPAPDAEFDEDGEPTNEDNTLSSWLYENSVEEAEMPFILADEITFYVE